MRALLLVLVAMTGLGCATRTGAPTTRTLTPSAAVAPIEPITPADELRRGAAEWDANRDGEVDDAERAGALFELRDVDDDGVLDPNELAAARDDWSPDRLVVRLADVDGDGEPEVVGIEPREGAPDLDGFDYFDDDHDGQITADELTPGMVASWDANGDGVLDASEWPG